MNINTKKLLIKYNGISLVQDLVSNTFEVYVRDRFEDVFKSQNQAEDLMNELLAKQELIQNYA